MACFSCGETFNGDVKFQLNKYKKIYEQTGQSYVYYKLEENGEIFICKTKQFFDVIKPNLFTKKAIKNGAEFALIQEFGQTSNIEVLGDNKE